MHPRSFARRWMRRVLTLPLMFVVVALVLFDDLFRPWVKSAVARLARLPLWRWIESRIARLSPYAALTLFLIPVAIIEPLKIYALYLMGLGHVIAGVLTLVVAKIVGVCLAERLFAASRDNLLSIPWFAWCFSRGRPEGHRPWLDHAQPGVDDGEAACDARQGGVMAPAGVGGPCAWGRSRSPCTAGCGSAAAVHRAQTGPAGDGRARKAAGADRLDGPSQNTPSSKNCGDSHIFLRGDEPLFSIEAIR